MQTINELCKPCDSVFADTARDDVLNLSDLIEGMIDPDKFFDENFKTKGMELLFETALFLHYSTFSKLNHLSMSRILLFLTNQVKCIFRVPITHQMTICMTTTKSCGCRQMAL